jgi:hypothetical protein
VNAFSPTRWSRTSRTRSTASWLLLLALTAPALRAQDIPLTSVETRDSKVVKRWKIGGDPRGVAVGNDGTLYVGLAGPQAVAAIDPKRGVITKKVILDSADIASTKELVSIRPDATGQRLLIANGSDESATILSLPSLSVLREITLEGESVRDFVSDGEGRHLFVLGRKVHVFDSAGQTRIKTLEVDDPMAIAISQSGSILAVIGSENFGNVTATVAVLFDTKTLNEIAREPMQTEKRVEAAMFAANDRALIAAGRDALFEKPLVKKAQKTMQSNASGQMRMAIDFGDLVSSERICLPTGAGAQILARGGAAGDVVYFAERRCSASGTFSGSDRRVMPASLYGIDAFALAVDRAANWIAVTEQGGLLTLYRLPRIALAK